MKITKMRTTITLAITCIALGLTPLTRAAHYTNYLDALQAAVSARLDNTDDASQRKTLTAANKTLNRNTKTLGQDLSVLSSAVNTLDKSFSDDSGITDLEAGALDGFIGEAEAQYNAVNSGSELITENFPKSLSNALSQAYNALTNAQQNTNFAARVRSLNFAFNKIRVAQIQLAHAIKAPESLDDGTVNVTWKAQGERPVKFTLDNNEGTKTYDTGAGETGVWSYNRTSANTGTIVLTPDGGGAAHTLNVTFKSSKNGTFAAEGEDVTGSISIK